MILSVADSFKVAADHARPRLLWPSPRRLARRSAGSSGRTSSTPMLRPISSRPGCSACGPSANLIAGLPHRAPDAGWAESFRSRAPAVPPRDPGAGRRPPAGGPAGRPAPGAAERALPSRSRMAGRECPRTSSPPSRGQGEAPSLSGSGSSEPTIPCCAPTASGCTARSRRGVDRGRPAPRDRVRLPARRTAPRCAWPSRRTRSCGRGPRCGSTSPGAGPTPRPTRCGTAAAW